MLSTATLTPQAATPVVVYPESDGKPMADNFKQLRWIVVLFDNLSALFAGVDVFIAANLFWYAVEGDEEERKAPDVFVVFGRPKGDRGSYLQWKEGGIPVTVAFEILSPNNTVYEMARKLAFYDDYGVEEYYIYDPEENTLLVYIRGRAALRLIPHKGEFTSPRLGIRFELTKPEMTVYYPDGRRFLSFEELEAERKRQHQRADQAEQRADQAEQRGARLAELSRKARKGEASAEELAELDRLEQAALAPRS
jgi:Uma2 family endonuclease